MVVGDQALWDCVEAADAILKSLPIGAYARKLALKLGFGDGK